jgi:hypothetical protein
VEHIAGCLTVFIHNCLIYANGDVQYKKKFFYCETMQNANELMKWLGYEAAADNSHENVKHINEVYSHVPFNPHLGQCPRGVSTCKCNHKNHTVQSYYKVTDKLMCVP